MKKLCPFILSLFFAVTASASHEIGNYISYQHLGSNNYKFTITQIRDCRPLNLGGGNPGALLGDDPLFVSIFRGDGTFFSFDSVRATLPNGEIIVQTDVDAPCLSTKPLVCLNKLTFIFTLTLPPSTNGYYIVSERCCLTDGLNNVLASGQVGLSTLTYLQNSHINSSAEFQQTIPQLLCVSSSNTLDFSASDIDGDSLSYSLCEVKRGASIHNTKPTLTSFSNIPIQFANGYSAQNPLNITDPNDFTLDERTGLLTLKPNLQGKFLIGICCTEWRNGVAIQENFRTNVLQAINCDVTLDITASLDQITPFDCPVKLNAEGAFSYKWSVQDPNAPSQNTVYLDNDSIQNPTVLFNQNPNKRSGEFIISVIGTDISNTCIGVDTVKLTVTEKDYFFIPNAFSPNGDGRNDQLSVLSSGIDFEYIKIYNRWGNKVFESNALDIKWDGTYKGAEAASDTYYWIARYRDKAKSRITTKGTVIILR